MDVRIEQFILRGRAAFERRDYESALADFRVVLEHHPHFADIRNLAGLCYGFMGQPERALVEFEHAVARNPQYVEAHLNRAITLNELGRFAEAKEAFALAGRSEVEGTGRFPGAVSARLANAHAELGDLYIAAAAPAEAAKQYRAALELRPQFHDIRNKLAQALIQIGELDAAEKELRTVLEGNDSFTAARLNLGLVLFQRGAVEEAIAEWVAVSEREPAHAQARAYLAMARQRTVPHGSPDAEDENQDESGTASRPGES